MFCRLWHKLKINIYVYGVMVQSCYFYCCLVMNFCYHIFSLFFRSEMGGSVLPGLGRFSTEKQESFLKLRSVSFHFVTRRRRLDAFTLAVQVRSQVRIHKCAPILIMHKKDYFMSMKKRF